MDILSAKVHIDPTLTGLDGMCILESESGTKSTSTTLMFLMPFVGIGSASRSFLQVATTKEAVAPPLRVVQIEELSMGLDTVDGGSAGNDRFTSEDHYEWLKDYSHFRHLIQQHITPTIRDYSLESALIIHAHCFSPNRYRLCEAIESNIKIWDLESKSIVVDLKVNMKQEFEMAAGGTTTQTNDRKTKAGLKEKALGPHTGGKSETWVNGESIGHYWPSYSVPNSYCADSCSYKGHMVGKMPRELQETVSGCNFQVESTKSSSLETYVLCVQPLLEKGIVDHSILHMTLVQMATKLMTLEAEDLSVVIGLRHNLYNSHILAFNLETKINGCKY
ncbi:hypothetical protein L6452_15974 [Arctium lappa]|uniref:Uncharacterized protein n=1 Tax=Arctium lappa TaxID=4217 RepID=A0ACB9CQ08_ARCLA|nr:hypothetical protein L6452_15974 [Arctium lappa]